MLQLNTMAVKGLSGCAFNTASPVGSLFVLTFLVLDGDTGRSATANRTISISNPCPNNNAPNFCA